MLDLGDGDEKNIYIYFKAYNMALMLLLVTSGDPGLMGTWAVWIRSHAFVLSSAVLFTPTSRTLGFLSRRYSLFSGSHRLAQLPSVRREGLKEFT